MVYRGRVCNGRIEVDDHVRLPEGASIEIIVPDDRNPPDDEEDSPTLYEQLKDFIGALDGLPPDLSVNLDHYLYGAPKQPCSRYSPTLPFTWRSSARATRSTRRLRPWHAGFVVGL